MTQQLSPALPVPAASHEPPAGFAGAPDARLIAQMANAFFSAGPGTSVPSAGVAPPSAPLIEAAPPGNPVAFPPTVIPGEADLRGILNQLVPAISLIPPDHSAGPQAPEAPAGLPDKSIPSLPSVPLGSPQALPADKPYFIDDGHSVSSRGEPAAGIASQIEPSPLGIELRPDLVPDLRSTGHGTRPFDAASFRRDFPILRETVHGKPLVWLDNAATTQKPQSVIDRLSYYYEHENSNVHRAAHALAARSTDAYEASREKVRRFLGAGSTEEIVFVRGATEGINLIAKAWGGRNVKEGDEIVITWLEHHANIVPWQQLCAQVGARLRVAPVDDSGQIILEEYEKLFSPRTRLASLTQVSNALGTVAPIAEMTAIARRHGACVLVDGAQAVSHMPVDVQALDCDFYVFSGHKVFGPTGIGAVYGRKSILDAMPPWQGGGNMIADVTFEKTIYQPAPARFEAGTGNIADAVGLGAAIDYVTAIGMHNIGAWEHELLTYGTQGLLTVPGLRVIGRAKEKAGVLSFVIDECRTEDVGKALDREGIAVRSGHHCAQPILRRFGLEATVRASLALYNTLEDIDALVDALLRLQSGRRTAS